MGCSRICMAGSVQKGPDGKIRVGCASAELPSTWYMSALAYPCSTRRAYRTVQRTGGDVLLQVSNSKPVKQPLPCTSIPLVQTRYKYKPSLYSIGSPSGSLHRFPSITSFPSQRQTYSNAMIQNHTSPDCVRSFYICKDL